MLTGTCTYKKPSKVMEWVLHLDIHARCHAPMLFKYTEAMPRTLHP